MPSTPDKTSSFKNVTHVKGTNFYRDAKKVKQLNMQKQGKAIRNKQGKIVKEAIFQSKLASGTVARVQANKQYFANTRTIGQRELEEFRNAMQTKMNDSYTVLLRQNKLPMSLLQDSSKQQRMNLLQVESFSNTFGVSTLVANGVSKECFYWFYCVLYWLITFSLLIYS